MSATALAHVLAGPLDLLIELGLPVLLLVALWAWARRAERRRGAGERDEEEAARPGRPSVDGEPER